MNAADSIESLYGERNLRPMARTRDMSSGKVVVHGESVSLGERCP